MRHVPPRLQTTGAGDQRGRANHKHTQNQAKTTNQAKTNTEAQTQPSSASRPFPMGGRDNATAQDTHATGPPTRRDPVNCKMNTIIRQSGEPLLGNNDRPSTMENARRRVGKLVITVVTFALIANRYHFINVLYKPGFLLYSMIWFSCRVAISNA